jgi:hypothetical protein
MCGCLFATCSESLLRSLTHKILCLFSFLHRYTAIDVDSRESAGSTQSTTPSRSKKFNLLHRGASHSPHNHPVPMHPRPQSPLSRDETSSQAPTPPGGSSHWRAPHHSPKHNRPVPLRIRPTSPPSSSESSIPHVQHHHPRVDRSPPSRTRSPHNQPVPIRSRPQSSQMSSAGASSGALHYCETVGRSSPTVRFTFLQDVLCPPPPPPPPPPQKKKKKKKNIKNKSAVEKKNYMKI